MWRRERRKDGPTYLAIAIIAILSLSIVVEAGKDSVSSKSTEAKGNSADGLQADPTWPSFWSHEKEALLREDVVIGVISTREQRNRISSLEATWMSPTRRERMVETYTDGPVDYDANNAVATRCGNDDSYGHWCKFTHMLKVWTTPRYRDVKWFVVVHDTSYLHLENLFEFVSTLNESKPILIGDINCSPLGVKYASGKAGFIFSRGVLDTFRWALWYEPTRISLKKHLYEYDKLWSNYMHAVEATLIRHQGMISGAFSASSDLLETYSKWSDRPWPFPFRPISSNQADDMDFMPELHKKLHALKSASADRLFPISNACNCKRGFESRCLAESTQGDQEPSCRFSQAQLKCLGQAKFDFDEHKKLSRSN